MLEKFALERVRPETVGISPSSILRYLKNIEQIKFINHCVMLIKNGKVAFEIYYKPITPEIRHLICSCSKSVTVTAIGFALSEGLFSIDDKVVDLLLEKINAPLHEHTKAMTVRHLLTMMTPFGNNVQGTTPDITREFLNAKPDYYPGTIFRYYSVGAHVLCEIVQKKTNMKMMEYLMPRFFEPLGIAPIEVSCGVSQLGINQGGGSMIFTPEAMAKFGLVYLNNGRIDSRQILPVGWAEEATKGYVNCTTMEGIYKNRYGYYFWRTQNNGFAALGRGGQAIVMHPEKNFVFVGTANGFNGLQTGNEYRNVECMWQLLYPEIKNDPIPFEDAVYAELSVYANNSEIYLSNCGELTSSVGMKYSGQYLSVEKNKFGYEGFTLTFNEKQGELTIKKGERIDLIPFGYSTHVQGSTCFQRRANNYIRGAYPNGSGNAGIWDDERTLIIQSHVINSLAYFIITCYFGDEAVVLEIVPFGIFTYSDLPCVLTHMNTKK